jgi:hypothetical protein
MIQLKPLNTWGVVTLLFCCCLTACKSDYEQLLTRELSNGIRHDSVFRAIHFGMSKTSFFDYCRVQNKSGQFHHGSEVAGTSVMCFLPVGTDTLTMNFFPDFEQEKLCHLWAVFRYYDWTPWQPEKQASELVKVVLQVAQQWYGGQFLALKTPKGNDFWVNVQGNRRVLISLPDQSTVRMEVTDMTTEFSKKPKPKDPRFQ